jgi:DNA-binding transcriptional LysR family regulator
MNNWSDYPIFLAVAETGSLTAAGEQLSISQPTVGRRMKALETRFGAPLLTKEGGRLTPTEFGYLVLDHARRMESEADAINRSSATLEHSLIGPVTITASEGMGDWWLPAALIGFHEDHPDILVDINVDMRSLNLAQREADIALRWMGPGTQNSLIGRKAARAGMGLYASKSYIQRHGLPTRPEDLLDHNGVRLQMGTQSFWPSDEQGTAIPLPRIVFKTNNMVANHHAIMAGYGIGMLAHCAIESREDMIRILPNVERCEDLWVVAHEDLKKSARIRATFDYLVDALQKDSEHFLNGAPSLYVDLQHPYLLNPDGQPVKKRVTVA